MKIFVNGIVQGVGFRPFVYRIAQDLGLKGLVRNVGGGVEIVLDAKNSEEFIHMMKLQVPDCARIDCIQISIYEGLEDFKGFEILESQENAFGLESKIPKDMAICKDCLKEMFDKKNRHYHYAFTTCTNCGPRYSIIASLPYDRKNTSMAPFKMCQECQREYDNPNDRRFGAQPNSCPKCAISIKFHRAEHIYENNPIKECIRAILNGEIVAIKGIGGFALVCDGRNSAAIKRLRDKKNRPKKPFALMVKNTQMALKFVDLNTQEIDALESKSAPIILGKAKKNNILSPYIAPSLHTFGVILPYSGIHHLLFESLDFPIVFTSANLSGEPIIASFIELKEKLGNVFESALDFEREIIHPIDDSVVAFLGKEMRVMRLGRSFAPLDLEIIANSHRENRIKTTLCIGLGAEQKSTLTYAINGKYLISPFIGDLNNPASMRRYEEIFEFFKEIYSLKPDILIHDLHPDYHSSVFSAKKSLEFRCRSISIQHHRAHFCAAFAEAMLQDSSIDPQSKMLGIIWDGTGLGDDGNIWGGEIFLGNLTGILRIGHFETLPLIGGEGAIKSIYKIGYGLALKYGLKALKDRFEQELDKQERVILKMMFEKNINTLHTSSVGRLFDGVASLCGLLDESSYEGEAGMLIESLVQNCVLKENEKKKYEFEIKNGIVRYDLMFLEMQQDILKGHIDKIAKKFINTLAQIAFALSENYPEYKVIFSGGVFQNRVLCDTIATLFEKKGKKFYMHKILPPNDGCISFGQAVYAQYNAL
ncbi:carbamoyltransferase HypF [Helicobacter sp. 12S02232-10]|nr:carbamoyltransferase HypF [Helicobacter sp. 12S02232-10]